MRPLLLTSLVCFLGLVAAAFAESPFVGTWEGKFNDLPGVEITIKESKERLVGTIVFFFQRRGDDGKWHVEGDKKAIPMFGPKVNGNILSFETIHYKAHGSTEVGPTAKFRMELAGSDEATLRKVDVERSEALKLTRHK